MRFFADESCDFSVVRALRQAGHNVVAVSEVFPRAADSMVLDLARRGKRILLTEDKDFGRLVYASGRRTGGVVFIRFPARARHILPECIVELCETKRLCGDTCESRRAPSIALQRRNAKPLPPGCMTYYVMAGVAETGA